jgi:hypothetical protein
MAKREAVGFLMTEKGFSERRACRIVRLFLSAIALAATVVFCL